MSISTIEEKVGYDVWITKKGESIKIVDMKSDHLQNTIAMIKRGFDASGRKVLKSKDNYLPFLEAEAIRRGLQPREDGWDADSNM